MAAIKVFGGDSVAPQSAQPQARLRAADYGPGALAEGLKGLGKAMGDYVDTRDQIEDINAKIEANRLLVEHGKLTQQIDERVKQTLGEGAEGVAEQGIADLEKANRELLGRAGPRAKRLLEPELGQRSIASRDQWVTHGFNEKKTAFEATAVAANAEDLDAATRTATEEEAKPYLASVVQRNSERANFFGWSNDQLQAQNRKDVSSYFVSKARLLASNGAQASAAAAIDYASRNRKYMTDEDFQSVLNSYHGAALEETALQESYGNLLPSTAVTDAPVSTAATADGKPQPTRALDPVNFFKTWMVEAEGSQYVIDNNGHGVKYGFNQKFNPDVNVKDLTLDTASSRFAANHWKRAGADKLPPALAAVHMDTFFLNEKKAASILKESGGDVQRYFDLRNQFLAGLHASNPAKYPDYSGRNKRLEQYVSRLGGDGTFPTIQITPQTNMTDVETSIMARTDVGLAYKRALVGAYRERRNAMRTEIEIKQSEAGDALTRQSVSLGDGFTSITQLDPQQLANASPQTVASLTSTAKTNRERNENKPMSPEVAAQVGFLQTFKPEAFADPKTQQQLIKMGVPLGTVRTLAQNAGQAQGTVSKVSREALEAVARPAFEAQGIRLWTTESSKDKKQAWERETREDPAMQANLLNYLDMQARTWARANPGKEPDEVTMRKWVGSALVTVQNGQAFGTVSNRDLVNMMSANDRRAIVDSLRAHNIAPTESAVANAYRQLRIARGR